MVVVKQGTNMRGGNWIHITGLRGTNDEINEEEEDA